MHLHGGFNFSDRYTKVTQSLDYKKAYLVWGISGEEKKCKMEGGIEFSRSFPMEFSMSLFD